MKSYRGHRFFLQIPALIRDPLVHLCSLTSGIEDMVEFRVGSYVTYLLNHPDQIRSVLYDHIPAFERTHLLGELRPLVGNGLLSSNEADWVEQRRILAPAFRADGDAEVAEAARRACTDAFGTWAAEPHGIDLEAQLKDMSLRILVDAMFSPDATPDRAAIITAINRILQFASLKSQMLRYARAPWRSFDPGRTNTPGQVMRALEVVDDFAYGVIDGCLAGALRPGRVVSLLVDALRQERITRTQARDEIATLLFAGFDTVAEMVTWALFLLAHHPETQERVRRDVYSGRAAGIAPEGGPMPVSPDRGSGDLLQRVLFEALRMYPSAWAIVRKAPAGQQLEDATLDKGAVMISPFTLHRNALYWPEPDRFDPSRFASCPASGTYIPFGFGKHTCIGRRPALVQGRVILSEILGRFRVSLPDTSMPRIRPGIILQAARPLKFDLENITPTSPDEQARP